MTAGEYEVLGPAKSAPPMASNNNRSSSTPKPAKILVAPPLAPPLKHIPKVEKEEDSGASVMETKRCDQVGFFTILTGVSRC